MTLFSFLVAVTFSAGSSAPTPLYHFYQEGIGLSPLIVTVIFGVYALSLLVALLTVGALSDYLGRRPVLFGAILANALAMVLFISAGSATALITARVVQGIAVGVATTTVGAAMVDTDKARGPTLNAVAAFIGLMTGSLGRGALLTVAPAPAQLVYLIVLVISAIQFLFLIGMPETTVGRSGAWASLRPHVRV